MYNNEFYLYDSTNNKKWIKILKQGIWDLLFNYNINL